VAGPLAATVEVAGPFKIETKPYHIGAKVLLAAAEATSEARGAESAPEAAQAEELPAAQGMKTANWIVLSALIGLGVAAAGVAICKKTG